MNCDRCQYEDTNECKHCQKETDPLMDKLKEVLEREERRIKGERN